MNRRFSSFLLAALFSFCLFISRSASGQTIVSFPAHDWTVKVGGKRYGLVEYGRPPSTPYYTEIVLGNFRTFVRVRIFVVAAVPFLLLVGLVFSAIQVH